MHVSDLAHEIAELRLVETHEHLVPESLWLENGLPRSNLWPNCGHASHARKKSIASEAC